MATYVSGFVVGFTVVWQLGLVTLAVVPLIAIIGGIHTTTLTSSLVKVKEVILCWFREVGEMSEWGSLIMSDVI